MNAVKRFRTLPLRLELDLDDPVGPEAEAAARARADDAEQLGIDDYVAESVAGASFERVVAHLLMFDPAWLFAQSWVRGWVATPEEAS